MGHLWPHKLQLQVSPLVNADDLCRCAVKLETFHQPSGCVGSGSAQKAASLPPDCLSATATRTPWVTSFVNDLLLS